MADEEAKPAIPKTYDWVSALATCSFDKQFDALLEVIEFDVNAANLLGTSGGRLSFYHDPAKAQKVIVSCDRVVAFDKVIFELATGAIVVTSRDSAGKETKRFSAKPTFNVQGECLLNVEGEDLRIWQVSRKALEDLFFGFSSE